MVTYSTQQFKIYIIYFVCTALILVSEGLYIICKKSERENKMFFFFEVETTELPLGFLEQDHMEH